MADSYTPQGFILPEPGGSLNTWGTKLNIVIQMLAAMLGSAAVAMTGVAATDTLAFSNGSYAATALPSYLKLTNGGIAAASALTLPAVAKWYLLRNSSGFTITAKVSGGTGVAIPNGGTVLVFYSAVDGDIVNLSPTQLPGDGVIQGALTVAGQIHGLSTGTAATDAVTVGQLAAAIAASVPAGTAGTFLNSISDTTRGFLGGAAGKLRVTGSLTMVTQNAGADEYSEIGFTFDEGQTALYAGIFAI
jgi:hypothetical protein